mmetsp:Transcript_4085/g.5395  ORF Transcript_4085/g.5395 Transcript_4085/m.5395 type:complete len:234 (+) Transcript_4085:147-848(+)|eukprot:CAMPEP_0196583026 /NCGR_PEP_ID=MMETSP1081-20130531/41747_1 /TAXON_ID=36882 /ORGANISM="Pyramimonas amylifera, Strain CCMP720" /LENGTH=233 /DNA_ID=CAMNT_0041903785 /DNA_START=145 /DNA_END=846 /DNA_ORIENTATION=-
MAVVASLLMASLVAVLSHWQQKHEKVSKKKDKEKFAKRDKKTLARPPPPAQLPARPPAQPPTQPQNQSTVHSTTRLISMDVNLKKCQSSTSCAIEEMTKSSTLLKSKSHPLHLKPDSMQDEEYVTYENAKVHEAHVTSASTQMAERHLTMGDDFFEMGMYKVAECHYTEGISFVFKDPILSSFLLSKRAACFQARESYRDALFDAEHALELDPSSLFAQKCRNEALISLVRRI